MLSLLFLLLGMLKPRAGVRPVIAAVTVVVLATGWLLVRDDGSTVGPFPFPAEAAVPDAPPDSSIDAPIDAPPVLDPNAVWTTNIIIPHADCTGADGTNLGDFDNDGDADIVTACEQGSSIWIARNDGGGTFFTYSMPLPVSGQGPISQPEDARFGDVDGDGKRDVVIAESGGAKLRWYRNNGAAGALAFDSPTKIGEGNQCLSGATPVTCKYMHVAVHSAGVVFAGTYSTGAEVSRFNASAPYTTWTHTTLTSAGWVKGLEVHGNDLLIWDYQKVATQGVRWVLTATGTPTTSRLTTDQYTLRGAKVGSQIAYAIGTSDGVSPGTTFGIVGGATATFPSDFGRAQSVNLCDVDGDGELDMMVTASHSNSPADDITEPPSALSSVAWLKGPGFTQRGEASGPLGIKHDNVECMDVDGDGDLDMVTTEEKSLGLIWLENPRIQSMHCVLLLVLLLVMMRMRGRRARGGF